MTENLRAMLDSNIVFSAARIADSDFLGFWDLPGVEILISQYILGEVSRHLAKPEQGRRLWQLVYRSHLVPNGESVSLPDHINLPFKDQPILKSAIAGEANILVTGDKSHFGVLFGTSIAGVLIEYTNDFKTRYPRHFRVRKGV